MLDLIKSIAERYYNESVFFEHASTGRFNKYHTEVYLNNLAFIFQQTIKLLDYAIPKAEALGMHAYAEFLKEKRAEEIGHDMWAKNDLNQLGTDDFSIDLQTKETRAYIDYSYKLIDQDPRFLFSYMFFAEAITVEAAPTLMNNLFTKCHLKKEFFSAITKHQVADEGHVEEDLKALKLYWTEADQEFLMVKHVLRYSMLFEYALSSYIQKGNELKNETTINQFSI